MSGTVMRFDTNVLVGGVLFLGYPDCEYASKRLVLLWVLLLLTVVNRALESMLHFSYIVGLDPEALLPQMPVYFVTMPKAATTRR